MVYSTVLFDYYIAYKNVYIAVYMLYNIFKYYVIQYGI